MSSRRRLPSGFSRALLLTTACCFKVSAQDAELQDRFFGQIYKAMGIAKGAIVADVGAGDRPVHALRMEKIVGPSGKIVCVDVDEKAVASLRESLEAEHTPNNTAQVGKPDDPMLPDKAFDAVLNFQRVPRDERASGNA